MLFPIQQIQNGYEVSPQGLAPVAPSTSGLLEKDIEHWLAKHPQILLPGEEVLVIGQSVAGQSMADVLAFDASGRLIIIEIKRDWSNRETIGQLLEYAAKLRSSTYEELQVAARKYRSDPALDLYQLFCTTFAEQIVAPEELGKRQRLLVVAPDADQNLQRIVEWLRSYGVPIQFVPFSIYADQSLTPQYLQIEGAAQLPEPASTTESGEPWAGHWIFNTNESYSRGAYEKMFARHVAAIYGYPNGPKNLEGARAGDRILAYVNQQGLRAIGVVLDGNVVAGQGIFLDESGQQQPGEFHLNVRWEAIVAPNAALSARQAKEMGYNLPVRSTFARLQQGQKAALLEQKLKSLAENSIR